MVGFVVSLVWLRIGLRSQGSILALYTFTTITHYLL